MLEASGGEASMFATVRTLVTLEARSGRKLFRRSGSTRSCLSSFFMSMSLLYKSWISGGISGASFAATSAKAITSYDPKPGDSGSQIDLVSEVCGLPGFLHFESSRVVRLIHTDYAKYYIAGHWKTGTKELKAWRGTGVPPTGKTGGGSLGPPRFRGAYELNTSQIG